jgi:S1-C subfamily serine protease
VLRIALPYPALEIPSRRAIAAWMSCVAAVCLLAAGTTRHAQAQQRGFAELMASVQPKMVKIYGAGGFRGLEAYQSGFLISPTGHILTVWSYVLDASVITIHLADGRKFEAQLLGADPRLELAVLKIEARDLPFFDLEAAADAAVGAQVLALSNLYGVATLNEPASVQHGVIAAKTRLEARRGAYDTPYRGPVYILDAVTNNPGAAGGALVNRRGELIGMLGKELRNSLNNTWLNYALPIVEIRDTALAIVRGEGVPLAPMSADTPKAERPLTLDMLGIVLVPDVLPRTPPFVDEVRPGSPAAEVGLQPDDLILFINNERLIQSCKALREELQYIDQDDPIVLTVIRGQELLEFRLRAQ